MDEGQHTGSAPSVAHVLGCLCCPCPLHHRRSLVSCAGDRRSLSVWLGDGQDCAGTCHRLWFCRPLYRSFGSYCVDAASYPLILAGVFKLFGVYTPLSAWVILVINSVFSAAVAPAVYEIADRCYGSREDGRNVAVWSGWLWALYPAAIQYAVRWVWEMSLTACLFSWILVFALR